jgi:hypothetical protein
MLYYECTAHKIESRWARYGGNRGRLPYNAEAIRLRQRFGGQAAKMQATEAYGTLRKATEGKKTLSEWLQP